MAKDTTDLSIPVRDLPEPTGKIPNPHLIAHGRTYPPQQQILMFSPEEWEEFILEWSHYQKTQYKRVTRLAGAGDLGIDVAAFSDEKGFAGVWDCYQCKHHAEALTPTTGYPEIAKILWHSFNKKCSIPRSYYFVAPWNCGPTLKKLLLAPANLKEDLIAEWSNKCAGKITSRSSVPLDGAFLTYVNAFDFSIFTYKETLTVIDEHATTPYRACRFGGGLPSRPNPLPPPNEVQDNESRYIHQLYSVYGEECGTEISGQEGLVGYPKLLEHHNRQRECFYSAEALRNFAREVVPPGTFEDLQGEIFNGVVDVEQLDHASSMVRLTAVTQAATDLQITSNGLISVTKVNDKKGICHQLANDDRLTWRKS